MNRFQWLVTTTSGVHWFVSACTAADARMKVLFHSGLSDLPVTASRL